MEYRHQIADFAERTLSNLRHIERIEQAERGADLGEVTAFPLTQLVGSLLGLVVFPQQRYEEHIPRVLLRDLVENRGWPALRVEHPNPNCKKREHRRCDDLRELSRVLRNGIAHCNLEFRVDEQGWDIASLRVANECHICRQETTVVNLSIEEAHELAERYADLIVSAAAENDGYKPRFPTGKRVRSA